MTSSDLPERPPADPKARRPATWRPRWTRSALDYQAQVMGDGDQPLDVVTARCGALLQMVVPEYNYPSDQKWPPCELILHADLDAPGQIRAEAARVTQVIRNSSAGLRV